MKYARQFTIHEANARPATKNAMRDAREILLIHIPVVIAKSRHLIR